MVEDQQQDAELSHETLIREQNIGADEIAEYRGAIKREREDGVDINDVALGMVEIQGKEVMGDEKKPDGEEGL